MMRDPSKVGAGDTARDWPDGLVQCRNCDQSRANGSAGVVWCVTFDHATSADAERLCTGFRPIGWMRNAG